MTSKTLKQFSQLTKEQLDAADWTQDREAGGLWMDVGTGKTVVLLTAIKRLIESFAARRVLVVGPRLVAERVWHTEVTEWSHLSGLRVSRIVGTVQQRLRAVAADADIYTISRDNVQWLEQLYIDIKAKRQIRAFPWDCLVLDESQSFKSASALRSKSVRRLRRLVSRCYLATGSLMPNGYRDVWHQMYLIDGGARLGKTETAFLTTYFDKEMMDGIPSYRLKKYAAQAIDKLVGEVFFVVRDAQPPAPNNFIKIQLDKTERAAYGRMVRTSVLEVPTGAITAVNAGVLWGKLLQMANGAVYDGTGAWHELHRRKLDALWELLESLPCPVIIGYGFVHDVERIFAGAPKTLGRIGVLRTGKSLDAWRRGELDIGVMHPASAGHGLNDLYVSGAENLVWFGFTSNREFYDQLNGRLAGGHRRTGRKVCIHHLVTEGTVDEDAQDMLAFKGDSQVAAQIRVAQRLREVACER